MGTRADTALAVVTIFWGFIGIVCPLLVQFCMGRSPNKGIVQIMFIMTAASCYLFWLCAFLFQLNPLVGPQLESNLIRIMQYEWMGIDPEHVSEVPK
ncbi:V-type proton ATPase subunit e 1-like isoform X2 [Ruditapes philippinarum]|uniref:V-type proton ATPase subunit e 1-like isoform X1 n=1 Tax=Ruditapes philippinarum TaxID=129788 RepID=UPI00295C2D34|nr:V-type proton ATPase subunit e 1-like isoform X1 [Ruditapes philippinarum]XP_060577167.1 V-type proton ATPase subunit e 1-like isoform X2 [Ruditapes philippinarum]